MIQLLMDRGAHVPSPCAHRDGAGCVFSAAATTHSLKTLRYLFDKGLGINVEKCPALFEACRRANHDVIGFLIDHNVSVNAQIDSSQNPLLAVL